jgi:hypothetical protein
LSEPSKVNVIALNELGKLISEITSAELRAGLAPGLGAADCDVRCGCNTRDCGCHGSVTSSFVDEVSDPEFQRMRQDRIDQLKAQLSRLEGSG